MAYKTRNGRRLTLPRGVTNTVERLVKLDGTKATFECRGGHRHVKDYSKGPVSQRMSAAALQRFRVYWGMDEVDGRICGHLYGWCQTCQNVWDDVSNPDRNHGKP